MRTIGVTDGRTVKTTATRPTVRNGATTGRIASGVVKAARVASTKGIGVMVGVSAGTTVMKKTALRKCAPTKDATGVP